MPLLGQPAVAVADSGVYMIPQPADRVLDEDKAEAEAITILG